MTYHQWRHSTKSKPIKWIELEFDYGWIHVDASKAIESALEAAYRAGLKHGRKDAVNTTK
ncbi:MAG: hypothetical protein UR19_C0015G0009 [Candidatus Nomurabacteria bacterium GW2011_GWF1_31_48]|uniref:Uncharacterized protein n=1 Tax=Candidatus Nomurabacteria bacterium GW2011_GWF1_31_48 TaxID=1618767 RepID=A0A0F9YDL0_9BACT|nr:MAG: hypothetical protein UR19_C0015G0009 [Candidatus Nomurabacteria bacterium GW2011_GWF1_31_48]